MTVIRSILVANMLLLLIGCSTEPESKRTGDPTCEQREARDYPALEQVATQTLAGMAYELVRVGACEDTGAPRATVQATLSKWNSRSIGVRYLKRHGWRPDYRGGLLLSSDKTFTAESTEVRAADAETSVVILSFTHFVADH